MRPDHAVQFIARAEAEEKLLAKGWTQGPCKACDGRGFHLIESPVPVGFNIPENFSPSRVCDACGGAKWVWSEPKQK